MKRFMLSILIVGFCINSLHARKKIGEIIQFKGDVDITSLTTGKRIRPELRTKIYSDYRIRTGKRSFTEILLHDGTRVMIRGITVINISHLKLYENQPPTRIKILTGKVRIIAKNKFGARSLTLKTPTAIASVRGTDFGIIASKNESRIIVFHGVIEVANINRNLIKSFIVMDREEVIIELNKPPVRPRTVPLDIYSAWFNYYDIDDRNRIVKSKTETGIIDRLLRKIE